MRKLCNRPLGGTLPLLAHAARRQHVLERVEVVHHTHQCILIHISCVCVLLPQIRKKKTCE